MFAQSHINLFFGLLIGCIFIRLFLCETSENFDSLVLAYENGNIKKFGGNAKDVSITLPNGQTKQIMRINDNGDLVITYGLVVDANVAKSTDHNVIAQHSGMTMLGGSVSAFSSGAVASTAPSIKGIYMGTGSIAGSKGKCANNNIYKQWHSMNLTGKQFIFIQSANVAPTTGSASFPNMRVISHDADSFEVVVCNNLSDTISFDWIIFLT